jgi:hypothetical protein
MFLATHNGSSVIKRAPAKSGKIYFRISGHLKAALSDGACYWTVSEDT